MQDSSGGHYTHKPGVQVKVMTKPGDGRVCGNSVLQSFFGKRLRIGSAITGDNAPMSQDRNAVGNGNAMRARLAARPRWMIAAAFSAGIRNGMGKSLTSVM